MNPQWTDINEIMRDLSLAQRSYVPAEVDGAIAGEKPPTANYTEDTEEEYYKKFAGGGDFKPPELHLIKEMLDMVRSDDGFDDGDINKKDDDAKVVEITKLNILATQFVPKTTGTGDSAAPSDSNNNSSTRASRKPRRHRNAAVESLLQAIMDDKNPPKMERSNGIKLMTPEDFMTNESNMEAKEKVENWLKSQEFSDNVSMDTLSTSSEDKTEFVNKEECLMHSAMNSSMKLDVKEDQSNEEKNPPAKKEKRKLCITPIMSTSMFRRKNIVKEEQPVEKMQPAEVVPQQTQYVPSEQAQEYYQGFLKQMELRDADEDIWSRAERKMKEIDERKKRELLKNKSTSSSASRLPSDMGTLEVDTIVNDNALTGIESIQLPAHRHTLSSSCVVCDVLCEKETTPTPSAPPLDMLDNESSNMTN